MSHACVAEECGFSHPTWVDQPNLSRGLYVCLTASVLSTQQIQLGLTDPLTYHRAIVANPTATLIRRNRISEKLMPAFRHLTRQPRSAGGKDR